MRSVVLSNRIRCLSQAALLGILGGLVAGCSSDVTRFDRNLYAALPTSKEASAYERAVAANQQYPGNVDNTTTGSIGSGNRPVPLANVATPQAAPDHNGNYNSPQPVYSAPQPQTGTAVQAAPSPSYNSGVVRQSLSAPTNSAPVALPAPKPAPSVSNEPAAVAATEVNNASSDTVRKANETQAVAEHTVETSSQKTSGNSTAANNKAGGWNKTGGTAIELRPGETLYNLSKRYGVPVKEIMAANSIKSASELRAGQQIIIPTYVYSRNAPVSAPDNDPKTKAASAARGTLAKSLNEQKEALQAASAKPEPDQGGQESPVSVSAAKTQTAGQYEVVSGDTLGKIANMHGTSVAALQKANGLNGTNIGIGQKLVIPAAGQQVVASVEPKKVETVPVVSSDAGKQAKTAVKAEEVSKPKPYVKPSVDKTISTGSVDAKAPERTGIKSLRWPVKGRVVSGFGAKKASGQNDGIDISVPEGTSVKAAENGVVIYSGSELEGFGNLVLVRHADGIVTAYAHNKSNLVSKGAEVKRGQVIAQSGKTGNVDRPTLHFEVRKNSKPVDPIKYLGG